MDVSAITEALAGQMSRQLRVKGDGLAEVTARAGRKLPKRLRAEAEILIKAEAMAKNPKLARLVNPSQIRKSERKLLKFLGRQSPASERRGEILDLIAKIAFVIFVVVLIAFFTLLNRGFFD